MATKSRRLKTPLQLWIADHRKSRGESSLDLANLTGVTEATARAWESRGRPSTDALDILERHFGEPSPGEGQAGGDPSALVAAIADQAAAIRELVDEMRLSRVQQDESTLVLLRAVAAVLPQGRAPQETPDDSEIEAHAGTGR